MPTWIVWVCSIRSREPVGSATTPEEELVTPGDIDLKDGAGSELNLEAGTVAMLEPTIITPDWLLGIFLGRTHVLTDGGARTGEGVPHELIVI